MNILVLRPRTKLLRLGHLTLLSNSLATNGQNVVEMYFVLLLPIRWLILYEAVETK